MIVGGVGEFICYMRLSDDGVVAIHCKVDIRTSMVSVMKYELFRNSGVVLV